MIMAELDDVEEGMRNKLMVSLVREGRELSEWDVGMLLLMAMDEDEVRARVEELRTGVIARELSCH